MYLCIKQHYVQYTNKRWSSVRLVTPVTEGDIITGSKVTTGSQVTASPGHVTRSQNTNGPPSLPTAVSDRRDAHSAGHQSGEPAEWHGVPQASLYARGSVREQLGYRRYICLRRRTPESASGYRRCVCVCMCVSMRLRVESCVRCESVNVTARGMPRVSPPA